MHTLDDHYKISFRYYTERGERPQKGEEPKSCICTLFKDDETIGFDSSTCSSEDHFRYSLARSIAFHRIVEGIENVLSKEEADYLWEKYGECFVLDPFYYNAWLKHDKKLD